MAVTKWPSYLLRGIPDHTRAAMTQRAEKDDISLADVVRQAVCARYRMDCDPASNGYQPDLDTGADVILVRMQPEVWKKLKKETGNRYGAVRQLMLESLDDYLKVGTQ